MLWWNIIKQWEKATVTLKTVKWHPSEPFSAPNIKQLNPWPNTLASHVENYSKLSTCQREMEPFKDHKRTHRHLSNFRNKPQQKKPSKHSVPILA